MAAPEEKAEKAPRMESTSLLEFVRACPFFASLQEDDLQLLLHYGKFNMFAKGKTVAKVGDYSMEMFFTVLSGEIIITTESGEVLQQLGRGAFVSDLEVSFLLDGRNGAIKTSRPTELFVWYMGLIKKHLPAFVKNLTKKPEPHEEPMTS